MNLGLSRSAVRLAITLMAASLVMNPAAWASNLSFLEDSPMTYFDKEDMRLQREAALKVLEDESSRAQQTWKNPATGHSGKVHGLGAFTSQDGLACRRVRIFNRAEGVESQATYTVCKYAEQGWMFDPSAQPAG